MQTLNAPVNKDSHAAADASNSSVISLAQSSFLHTALGGLDLRLDEELERYRHWQDNGMSYLKPFQPQSQKENSFGSLGVGLGGDSFVNASAYPPAKPKLPRQSIDLPNPMAAATSSPAPVNPGVTPYSVSGKTNQTTLQSQPPAQPSPLPKPQSHTSRPPVDEPLPLHTPRLELPLEPLNTEYGGPSSNGNNNGAHNGSYNPNYNGNGSYSNGAATMPQPVPQAFVIPPIATATAPEPPLKDADAVNQPVTEDEFLKNLSDIYPETPNLVEEEPLPPPPPHPAVVVVASLLNPVGLISLLLLLVSSATIGYLLVDPSGVIRIFNPSYGKAAPAVKVNPSEEPTENHSPKSNSRQRTETTTIPFVPSTGSAGALTTPNGLPATVPANSTAKTSPAPTTGNNNGRTNQTPAPSFNRNTPVANDTPRNNAPTNAITPLALPPVVNEPPAEAPRPVSRPASRPASRVIPAAPVATRPARNTTAASSSMSSGSSSTMAASGNTNTNNGVRYGAPLTSLPMATESAPTRPSSYRVSVDSEYAQQAQKVQPDAFTRSSDGQTQLGSYRDPNAAAQRVEELRRQGIPAKVE